MAVDFHHWSDMYHLWRNKAGMRGLGVAEMYNQIRGFFAYGPEEVVGTKQQRIQSLHAAQAEHDWHKAGKPYYKVWPRMCRHLMDCNIDVSGSYLHLPFETFEIRLPKTDPIRERADTPPVTAMLVHKVSQEEGRGDGRDWTFIMHYQIEGEFSDMSVDWMGWFYAMGVHCNRKLSEQFEIAWDASEKYDDGTYEPGREFTQRLFRLAVSVCFFGLHSHDLICPDIPNRYVDRWHRAKREGDKSEAQKLLERAKAMGHFGWKVGSEIDLPATEFRHHTLDEPSQPGSGRELTAGHVRCGHLRLQAYGPKDSPTEHKLIFIPPTVVRPDLPLRDVRGFRIRDEVLNY